MLSPCFPEFFPAWLGKWAVPHHMSFIFNPPARTEKGNWGPAFQESLFASILGLVKEEVVGHVHFGSDRTWPCLFPNLLPIDRDEERFDLGCWGEECLVDQ